MGTTRSFFQSILYSDKAPCFHHQTDLVSAHMLPAPLTHSCFLRPCGNLLTDSDLFYRKGFSWRISRSYLHSQFFFPPPIVHGLRLLSTLVTLVAKVVYSSLLEPSPHRSRLSFNDPYPSTRIAPLSPNRRRKVQIGIELAQAVCAGG